MSTKRLNIDILAKDKSKQALNGVRGNLDGVKKSVFNLRNALIGIGAGAVLKSFVDVGKEVESLQVRFKFLFGSVEEGQIAFDNLTKFASKVPFSLEEISRASGNLAVVADDANDLNRILEITGNVAAVTGLDFETTSSQIQRAFSGGIGAADLFRERGVRALLGFKAGATVTAEETIARFEELFGGDGKFAKATDDLATTLEGTLSMLGDKYFNFQKNVADEFFDELKKEFGDLNVFLEQNADDIEEIARGIGTTLAQAIILLGDAVRFTKDAFDFLNRPITEISFELFKMEGVVELLREKFPEATDAVDDFVDSLMGIKKGDYIGEIDTIIKANDRLMKSLKKYDTESSFEEITLDNTFAIKSMGTELDNTSSSVRTFNSGFMETLGRARDLKTQFDDLATNTFNNFTDTLADALMTGKFAFKDFARSILADIARIIARQLALLAIQRALGFMGFSMPNMVGVGLPSFGGARANGGNVTAGKSYLVGERGAEMFVPNQSGTIIPNEKMAGTTNINFTINTVDARGVDELLTNRRSTIINVINDALNRQGKEALV